jgi:arylformamidase
MAPRIVTPAWACHPFDAAAREREYSPSSCIGGHYQPFIDAYRDTSAHARAVTPGQLNLRYGPCEAQRLDYFAPPMGALQAPPPLLVFIHGGYWQELSKDSASFAATDGVAQGMAFAALNYTLAPHASIATMVAECKQAIAWLYQHAGQLGFDAKRIVLAGSSAGAHLAAMAALPAHGQTTTQTLVHATVLVSGIFALEPLLGTSINDALGLDTATAQALSPLLLPLQGFPPSVVCWGAVETQTFKQQSLAMVERLRAVGTPCRTFEVPARNHFDVIMDLVKPGTLLGDATAQLMAVQR